MNLLSDILVLLRSLSPMLLTVSIPVLTHNKTALSSLKISSFKFEFTVMSASRTFFKKVLEAISPFCGATDTPFRTYDDVCPWFQSQGGFPRLRVSSPAPVELDDNYFQITTFTQYCT